MFRLAVECNGGGSIAAGDTLGRIRARGMTLHDADLFEFKRGTATFVCSCPGSPDNHVITRKVSGLRTCTTGDHRTLVLIAGTKFKLAVPDTIPLNSYHKNGFEFGGIRFTPVVFNHRVVAVKPDKPLPESWTIDIGESYEIL